MPFCKIASQLKLPPFIMHSLVHGAGLLLLAGITFIISLNDSWDQYRLVHGLSQACAGAALYYMWQTIPTDNYKKTDIMPMSLPVYA